MKTHKIHLAFLWHFHQPMYKNVIEQQKGSYYMPWVRLHSTRDYFSMASMLKKYPMIHSTFNFVPSLLWQIEDYLNNSATDRELELSLIPVSKLSAFDKNYILRHFFDANYTTHIEPYPRYKELLEKKQAKKRFAHQDWLDLKVWFNLSWFGEEFKQGEVRLSDSSMITVENFIEKGRGFNEEDMCQIVELQYKIMGNIIPIYKELQEKGQIEVSTTPFYHPIIPLVYDTNQATIDKEGLKLPLRFSRPGDAKAQINLAVKYYSKVFGRLPRGMWPSEGAVSQSTIHLFAQAGLNWIASDQGVLQKSGKYGYEAYKPEVLCSPYLAVDEEKNSRITIFFRETKLSNVISFDYQGYKDYEQAAKEFINWIKVEFAEKVAGKDKILTVILDGENPWGTYRHSGIEFLNALYKNLSASKDIVTVTFSEYLTGNSQRGILAHPQHCQNRVYDLFCASWIDQFGSLPGNDMGTWIGEEEKNKAWELLGLVRNDLDKKGINPDKYPEVFESIYAAEGSDWFWWYGSDYSSGRDAQFDILFRNHLKNVYLKLGVSPPEILDKPIIHKLSNYEL
ncbi:MAG: glycoside hydrolase family 57 protein [bacterium]|nr:glycoside hydrolase family 57 protein [bacterium]